MTCDVENVYLNAPCREKIWFVDGQEHGEKRGKVMVVVWFEIVRGILESNFCGYFTHNELHTYLGRP